VPLLLFGGVEKSSAYCLTSRRDAASEMREVISSVSWTEEDSTHEISYRTVFRSTVAGAFEAALDSGGIA